MTQKHSASFAAQPVQGIWTQVESFMLVGQANLPEDSQIHVLAIVADQGQFVNLGSFHQSLYLRLKTAAKHYWADKPDRFVATLHQLISELAQDTSEFKLELVVGYQFGDQLIVGGTGGASVTLVRGTQLGKILDTGLEPVVVHGEMMPGDIVILCSRQFYTAFPYGRLQQLFINRLDSVSLETIAAELVVGLKRSQKEAGVGFIMNRYIPAEVTTSPALSKRRWWKMSWFKAPLAKLKRVYLKQKPVRRPINRKAIATTLAILIILLVSTSVAYWQQQRRTQQRLFDEKIIAVQNLQSQAQAQETLNPLRARDLVSQAQTQLQTLAQEYEPQPRFAPVLQQLHQDLESLYLRVSGEIHTTPELFHDLTLIQSNFFGEQMTLWDERLLLLDTNNHQAISLGVANKNPGPVVGGASLTGARFVTGGGDKAYIWTNTHVASWDPGTGTIETNIITDPDWRQVVAMEAFATNLYILDAELGEIWRYRPVTGDQYSRERWLANSVRPDFSQVVDMKIDGQIWTLSKTGQVYRFSLGNSQKLALTGFEGAIEASALALSDDRLFILDRSNNRVLVFDQEGFYQHQYLWESNLGLVTDIVVSGQNLLLLSGSKLYRISL